MRFSFTVFDGEAGIGQIQPALVQPKTLHPVRVFLVNIPQHTGKVLVQGEIRRDGHQLRTSLLRLPYGHAGLDAKPFGQLIARQHDAVPLLRIAADGQGLALTFRPVQALHGGVERVGVCVQNHSWHQTSPLAKTFVLI